MSLQTADYEYDLPEELIARYPLPRREDSRMMVLHRATQTLEHRRFSDFPEYLRPGDLTVLNDTRVIPARVFSDDKRVELLLLNATEMNTWTCLVKPGRRMRIGATVVIGDVSGEVLSILPDGERIIRFESSLDLDRVGELPLPPYFKRRPEPSDTERYQTVYAREPGAVAAPTAGLHFTPEIVARIPHTFITLHAGVGTFRPVQVENILEHRMHEERFQVSAEAAEKIENAQRVIAVGTTSTRVLETVGRPVRATEGNSAIFIYPGYQFQVIGALLTNFHLPRSTLLMLVSAFAGREFVLHACREAVREKYRFYSYGDCMLLL